MSEDEWSFAKVDLEYPEKFYNIYNKHNDFLLALESMTLKQGSKYMCKVEELYKDKPRNTTMFQNWYQAYITRKTTRSTTEHWTNSW